MKILVTGSAGFIGSTLSEKLLERGDDVIGIDNHNDYYDPKIKEARLEKLKKYPNYKHFKIDLSDQKNLEDVFNSHKPQKVVNLAAQAGVRYSIKNPLAYINSNIVGFAHILENCRHHKVEHLVYASTSSVYGASKLQGEKNIMEWLSSYFIIRTSWLYSEFGSNFVKTILRLTDTQKEIKVVSDQIGSPTNAHDLADFLLEIISINSTNYGTYHFSNTGETSWYGFAKEVFRICNVSADLQPISSSAYASLANRPKYSVLDTKKGKKTFNVNLDYWVDSLKKVNFNL